MTPPHLIGRRLLAILPNPLGVLGVAVLYLLVGIAIYRYFSVIGIDPVVWPSSGIAMAALLLGGIQYGWSVLIGTMATDLLSGITISDALNNSLTHTIQALIGYWLLTGNKSIPYRLVSLRDYLRLVALGAAVSNVIAAIIGSPGMIEHYATMTAATLQRLFHHIEDDITGIALVTPFILAAWHGDWSIQKKSHALTHASIILATFLTGQFVFLGWGATYLGNVQYGYWMFLFVVWIAIYSGTRGVTLVLLVIALQAMLGSAHGVGFFAHDIAKSGLQNCIAYLTVLSVVGIALATYSSEARVREEALRIAAIAFEAQEGISITDADGVILRTNRSFKTITGYTEEELVGRRSNILKSERHDANFYAEMWATIQTRGAWANEIWNRRKSGEVFPAYLTITAVTDKNGNLTNYVGTFTDITEHKRLSEIIFHQANFDQMTGLPNRSLLFDRLSERISQARRTNTLVALLFIDLDGFKAVNDRHGHDAGNVVLKTVAQRFSHAIRETDTIARIGGDEFVVICSAIDAPHDAAPIAEKLIGALVVGIQIPSGQTCRVGASIGISLYPTNAVEIDSLLSSADAAMYDSKMRGKNTYSFSSTSAGEIMMADHWIVFDESHLIGVSAIDQQHRELVRLLNELNTRVLYNPDNSEIKGLFEHLIEYTALHFETECQLMEQHHYPYLAPHDSAHKRLICVLTNFAHQLHLGKELLALQSTKDWLIEHIKNEDKLFGVFLMSKGIT